MQRNIKTSFLINWNNKDYFHFRFDEINLILNVIILWYESALKDDKIRCDA